MNRALSPVVPFGVFCYAALACSSSSTDPPNAPGHGGDADSTGDAADATATPDDVSDLGQASNLDVGSVLGSDAPADAFNGPPGCMTGDDCASGICTNGECEHCQNDHECVDHVCSNGTCTARCASQADCMDGNDCCDGRCVDLKRDINNCGSCGVACTVLQICISTGCAFPTIANICGNVRTTLIKDGVESDDSSNQLIQDSLAAHCSPAPMADVLEKGVLGAINPVTGRPLAGGGNLLTVAGGSYVQKVVNYLDLTEVTPIYLTNPNQMWQYVKRADNSVVAELPLSTFSTTHDIFLIEIVRDIRSGTPILIAFGQRAESTAAAGWYVANEMLPNSASYDRRWYAYEWIAASDEGGAATFTLVASGR